MEEGLFQLLFILFFIVAAIFDAVARSRGKRRQMEEMETEEGAQDVGATAEADRADPEAAKRRRAERAQARWERMEQQRRDRGKASDGRGRETEAAAETRDSRQSGESAGQGRGTSGTEPERQTADSMVPDDFWAILTGQPSSSSRSEPEAEPQVEPAEVVISEAEPPREPRIPAPVPSDRWTSGSRSGARKPRVPEPPVETRRSSRWMEGVGGREDSSRWTKGMDEEEKRVYTLPPEPWEELEDITAGDISDGRGRVQGSVEGAAATGEEGRRRRGSGRGAYTRLLETGEIEDMRKAIVLREVLGTPVGFRKQDRDWDLG